MPDVEAMPAQHRLRAAPLLLACLSNDGFDEANRVMNEADAEDEGVGGLIAALCVACLDMLVSAVGEQSARANLELHAANAELDLSMGASDG
jgi:hypothetical protein